MPLEIHLYPRSGRPTTAEEHAVEALHARLDRFKRYLRRVGVRIDQIIGSRGTFEQVCRVHVTLVAVLDVPKLVVEGRAPNVHEAADGAADAAENAVRREVEEAELLFARRRKHRAARAKLAGRPRPEARREASEG